MTRAWALSLPGIATHFGDERHGTRCGRVGVRCLTRDWSKVNCRTCLRTRRKGPESMTAEQIARVAHAEQRDKAGRPYVSHLERVVARVAGDPIAERVAWLHDVLEDTSLTSESLAYMGVAQEVHDAVVMLTRVPGLDYQTYIKQIGRVGGVALRVKIADLQDHLETPGCPESLEWRYWPALAYLQTRANRAVPA